MSTLFQSLHIHIQYRHSDVAPPVSHFWLPGFLTATDNSAHTEIQGNYHLSAGSKH